MITEETTLGQLNRELQLLGLTECRITVHLGVLLTCYVGDQVRSVGAYGQGATIAEAINAALVEWAHNTRPPRTLGDGKCPRCGGSGFATLFGGRQVDCAACDGTGRVS